MRLFERFLFENVSQDHTKYKHENYKNPEELGQLHSSFTRWQNGNVVLVLAAVGDYICGGM